MARYPRLLHPVDVRIEQIDTASTVYDEDAREPIQQAARATVVTVKGQAKYGTAQEAEYEAGGLRQGERGYVLFREKDLSAASLTLNINDRFTKIGRVDHDVYISRLEPLGHYGRHGGNTLVKAYFADRQPSKHRRTA